MRCAAFASLRTARALSFRAQGSARAVRARCKREAGARGAERRCSVPPCASATPGLAAAAAHGEVGRGASGSGIASADSPLHVAPPLDGTFEGARSQVQPCADAWPGASTPKLSHGQTYKCACIGLTKMGTLRNLTDSRNHSPCTRT
eukprot:1404713-Pleurochrysis_carterae.AAC.3